MRQFFSHLLLITSLFLLTGCATHYGSTYPSPSYVPYGNSSLYGHSRFGHSRFGHQGFRGYSRFGSHRGFYGHSRFSGHRGFYGRSYFGGHRGFRH